MARKTNINNLTIVWQGQSWSVLTPHGHVVARFDDKSEATRFAKSNFDYVDDLSTQKMKNDKPFQYEFDTNFGNFKSYERFEVDAGVSTWSFLFFYGGTVIVYLILLAISPIAEGLSWKISVRPITNSIISLTHQNYSIFLVILFCLAIPAIIWLVSKYQIFWITKMIRPLVLVTSPIIGGIGSGITTVLMIGGLFDSRISSLNMLIISIIIVLFSYFLFQAGDEL